MEFNSRLDENLSAAANIKVDDWVRWYEYVWDDDESEFDFETNKEELIKKLARLKELIAENEKHFGEDRCFL